MRKLIVRQIYCFFGMSVFAEIPVLKLNIVAQINSAGDLFLHLSLGLARHSGFKTKHRRGNLSLAGFIFSSEFRFSLSN